MENNVKTVRAAQTPYGKKFHIGRINGGYDIHPDWQHSAYCGTIIAPYAPTSSLNVHDPLLCKSCVKSAKSHGEL